MNKIHILTDSNCHIPAALCQELEITVVPLPYVWDGKTYLDNIDIGPREFYTRLRKSKTIPTTSGPTPGSFKEHFEKLAVDGKPILAILVGDSFSSTLSTAKLAAEMFPPGTITVIDSGSNSMGLGFQVLASARAAREGKTLEEILGIVDRVKANNGLVFFIADLTYILKGGRISHLQYFIATSLKILPILEIRNNTVKPVERLRHHKDIIPRLLHQTSARIGDERPLRLAAIHTDNEADAWNLSKAADEFFHPDELITAELSPALGIHAGPGAFGLAYATGA